MFMVKYYQTNSFRFFTDSISNKEKIESRLNNYDRWITEFTYSDNNKREAAKTVDEKLANFVFFDPRDLSCACFIARSWELKTDDELTSLVQRLNTARLMVTQNLSSGRIFCWWGSNVAIMPNGIQILDKQAL